MECCHKNAAWLLSAVQIGGNNVEFWAPLKMNFIKKTCILEDETLVSSLT